MKEERLWELVALKLSGEASSEELSELDSLINSSHELNFKIEFLAKIWQQKEKVATTTEDTFNRHLQRLSNHCTAPPMQYDTDDSTSDATIAFNTQRSYKSVLFWFASVAAVLIVAAIAIFLINYKNSVLNAAQNIVTTKPGSKSKIILPDGTQVWLNSDSKITYDKNFGESIREVVLTGEAYFDVVKDKNRPFIIHSKSIDVKVLGTAFNIRSYPDESTSETSLIRGIVEVTLKGSPDKKIILKPNEKLVVQNDPVEAVSKQIQSSPNINTPVLTLSKLRYFKGDSTAIETSWIKNKLAFDEESFDVVAKKIEKWYGVNISIKDNKLKSEAFSGVFEDETLAEVMDALKLTGSFKYSINKRDVTVEP